MLKSVILKIASVPPAEEILVQTLETLNQGGVLAYPTETVYGLGCDSFCEDALQRIRRLKGREGGKSFLILIPSPEAVDGLAGRISKSARQLMDAFWPGPLTLLFESRPEVPAWLKNGTGRIGVRISPDPVCSAVMERYRKPLVSTSANPTGQEPARNAEEVFAFFGNRLDLILDHGERASSAASTVVDVSGSVPLMVRQGPVNLEALRNAVGEVREQTPV